MARPARLPEEVHRGARTYTWPELVALASVHQVRAAVASQEVSAVLPGRYVSTPHLWSLRTRAHAATAAGAGVLTGAAALFAWGGLKRAPDRVLVTRARGHRLATRPWLESIETRATIAVAGNWGPVPVASPAVACVHEWMRGDPDRRAGRVIEALQRRATTTDAIREVLADTARLRDRAGLIETLAAFDGGAHSFLELEAMLRTFSGEEFARFVRQHEVRARGRRYVIDMYDAATRTAVELDGDERHAYGEDRERDLDRDADLATLGIQTIRLTYRRVMDTPDWCRRTVTAVLQARSHYRMP
ncbi:endonuclease domain-containing protein [Demequina iriomotensis]|uniref:endonuclease domain-containing protein n=1 Tax=Demequina iriomotensis TaxID=1536641 RepID=UPI0007809ED8|nr:DUF559 domain-containing protein [Demequina iriomotensis]